MNFQSIIHATQASGGVLYVMMVFLFIALTVIIEREWYLRTALSQGKSVIDEIETSDHIDTAVLNAIALKYPNLPHAAVIKVALRHDTGHDFDRFPDKLDESIMKSAPRIDRFLWILDTIVTMAPLLGLLGTIIGMFNAFHVLGNPGSAPNKITGGVAEALIATASGLCIAIIGLFFFNNLNNRARVVMHQLETLKLMLANRMHTRYQQQKDVVRPIKNQAGAAR
ncbi:MotA/TolQ/ExbB proton channel family protein [Acidihalobacter yilgarnensis]|nr:MotA/TolQ/ExbB proton channel family protein [Acidihalobacter yilgarnensis]